MRLATALLALALACAPAAPVRPAASARPAAPPRIGADLVVLQSGGALTLIGMPEGKELKTFYGPFAGLAAAEDEAAVYVAVTSRDRTPDGPEPRQGPERLWTSIQRIDLRQAERSSWIAAGTVELAVPRGWFGSGAWNAPPVGLARVPGGDALILARGENAPHPAVRLERYDTHTGDRLAARRIDLPQGPLQGRLGEGPSSPLSPTPPRLLPIDAERALVVSSTYDWTRTRSEWRLVGADLADLATRRGESTYASESGDPRTIAWTQWCRPSAHRLPGRALVLLCEDAAFKRMLHVVDVGDLAEIAAIPLPNRFQAGSALVWRVGTDAVATVLTDQTVITEKPMLIRVHLLSATLVDSRPVEAAGAFPFSRFPVRLFGQTQGVALFSSDGRVVFVTQSDDVHRRRLLAAIDIASAKVVATQFSGLDVRSLRLSPDGRRLYAVAADGSTPDAPTRLALLDPRTLRVLARTDPLLPTPQQIVAVARR